MSDRRIRIGIDVGGTFTKAIALDIVTGEILSSSTVPTTHTAERGVSAGIVTVLSNLLKESKIRLNEIEIIGYIKKKISTKTCQDQYSMLFRTS